MPCDTRSRKVAEQRERQRQYEALETRLKNKTAQIMKLGNTVSIEGWEERGGWCDACVIRKLKQSEDFEIRNMIANAVPQMEGITFGHGH